MSVRIESGKCVSEKYKGDIVITVARIDDAAGVSEVICDNLSNHKASCHDLLDQQTYAKAVCKKTEKVCDFFEGGVLVTSAIGVERK